MNRKRNQNLTKRKKAGKRKYKIKLRQNSINNSSQDLEKFPKLNHKKECHQEVHSFFISNMNVPEKLSYYSETANHLGLTGLAHNHTNCSYED